MTKKNTKPAKKVAAKKAAPAQLPTNWETTLTPRNAWIVRELAKKEQVSDEEAYGRILNAGLMACGEIVPLPAFVDPKWKSGEAERKERIKRMNERWRNRPSLEDVGMAFEDDGTKLVVTVGGEAYQTLKKGAEAINKTLGCRAEPADVFKGAVMVEPVLTLPETELFDAICSEWFCYPDEPGYAEQVDALEKHLRAVGLREEWWGPSKKKPAKKSAPSKSKRASK